MPNELESIGTNFFVMIDVSLVLINESTKSVHKACTKTKKKETITNLMQISLPSYFKELIDLAERQVCLNLVVRGASYIVLVS